MAAFLPARPRRGRVTLLPLANRNAIDRAVSRRAVALFRLGQDFPRRWLKRLTGTHAGLARSAQTIAGATVAAVLAELLGGLAGAAAAGVWGRLGRSRW